MHTHPLAEYMKFVNANDWAGVAELMMSSAEKLARAGADFLICPDNTISPGIRPDRTPFAAAVAAHCARSCVRSHPAALQTHR